jgi:hypothetical protein
MSSGPNVEDFTPGGWSKAGDDRWRRVDEIGVMHLMIRDTPPGTDAQRAELTRFFELHGLTLHVYRGPTGPVDDVWPMGDPSKYDPAVHNFTHEGTYDVSTSMLPLITDEEEAWKWLERYATHHGASR